MRLFLIILPLFFCGILAAQKDSTFHSPQNAIHVEGGGNAVYYSVNYSRLFYDAHKPVHAARIGCGVMPQYDRAEYFIPFEFTWLIGKGKHFFEIGPGVMLHSGIEIYYALGNGGQVTYSRESKLIGSLRIGYCFIPLRKNNLFVRAAFTPLLLPRNYSFDQRYENGIFLLTGGISLGWAF